MLSSAPAAHLVYRQVVAQLHDGEVVEPVRRGFGRQVARGGLTLELGARGLTALRLGGYIELARELDVRLLRFVIDQDAYRPSSAAVIALVRRAVPALERAGLTLALENHDRFPAAVLRSMVDEVASPRVGVCLDTANSLGAGEGLAEVTRLLAPVTVNVHVKDVAIERLPHQMGFSIEGRPLGRGCLPIAATIAAVRAAGRCHSVILEAWTPRGATLAATLRREAAWARRSLAALPNVIASS